MLVLTIRVGETFMIDDNVQVKVVGSKQGQVRVGITAPRTIQVHREEVYKKIKKEIELAAIEREINR